MRDYYDVTALGNPTPGDRKALQQTMEALNARLEAHFGSLASSRARLQPSPPVFALEHGLGDGDLRVLEDAVRSWVRLLRAPRKLWLPFVVFATEVGYRYEGDEYWPTLEARAPGWEQQIGRHWLKNRFKDFAGSFGGAEPRGRWASHFSIICWPITHAVLPTDLQRQLARLLYESRGLLTSDLLSDPSELGDELAARSLGASKRFQQFAENASLLGHVAAALLAESTTSTSLLPATLERIVEDLSKERQARRWLGDARRTADRVRLAGLAGSEGSKGGRERISAAHTASVTAPLVLSLHPSAAGWQLRFRVPDLTPLLVRRPGIGDELGNVRCRIAQSAGRPKPRGWLLYAGQQAAIDTWPGSDQPLFVLERASDQVTDLLNQEVRTPSSDTWLFRIGPDGSARLVRSGSVRPGERYVLLGPRGFPVHAPWISEIATTCDGATAVHLDVPEQTDDACRSVLEELSLGIQTSVMVEPVGLVPAAWDGEGYAEWLTGDEPILTLSGSHLVESCLVAVNGVDQRQVRCDNPHEPVLVQLQDLTPGTHVIEFAFLTPSGSPPVPSGRLVLRVREPEPGRPSGTFRDPLRIRVSPPAAPMEDVWDNKASLWIDGPSGSRVTVRATLWRAEAEAETASHSAVLRLPASDSEWGTWFESNMRSEPRLQDAYDESTRLEIVVEDAELGSASVTFERLLEPLRWGFRRRRRQTSATLLESADTGSTVTIEYYAFDHPDVAHGVAPDQRTLSTSAGGLFVARLDDYVASALLPAEVRDLRDLRAAGTVPSLQEYDRSVSAVLHLAGCTAAWSAARSPGDMLAEMARRNVLLALRSGLGGLIGGKLWKSIERRHSRGEELDLGALQEALARPSDWSWFRQRVERLADEWTDPEPPIDEFADIFGRRSTDVGRSQIQSSSARSMHGRYPGSKIGEDGAWMAEFLLRLASAPNPLAGTSPERAASGIRELLEHPVGYRAARLLAIHAQQRGRAWQWPF